MWSARCLLFPKQTGSRLPILEVQNPILAVSRLWWTFSHGRMPILAVSRLHLIDPSSIEHNSAWINHLITLVSAVCVCVHRSVVDRLRPQFFTDFHQTSHAARKFGCFKRYCFCDKLEVDYRFWWCAKSDFGSFAIVVDIFSHRLSQKPELKYN